MQGRQLQVLAGIKEKPVLYCAEKQKAVPVQCKAYENSLDD